MTQLDGGPGVSIVVFQDHPIGNFRAPDASAVFLGSLLRHEDPLRCTASENGFSIVVQVPQPWKHTVQRSWVLRVSWAWRVQDLDHLVGSNRGVLGSLVDGSPC